MAEAWIYARPVASINDEAAVTVRAAEDLAARLDGILDVDFGPCLTNPDLTDLSSRAHSRQLARSP
ncbi:hypothetical protein [Novosphingobium sp. 9U]|uniref:hypothetical protein n=1 Tax=Novosphingobium sp. 9U TaxID=2653158 RepID=UPI00135B0726|nr:hypothetical protein [Novosphingobium sp. 9U]